MNDWCNFSFSFSFELIILGKSCAPHLQGRNCKGNMESPVLTDLEAMETEKGDAPPSYPPQTGLEEPWGGGNGLGGDGPTREDLEKPETSELAVLDSSSGEEDEGLTDALEILQERAQTKAGRCNTRRKVWRALGGTAALTLGAIIVWLLVERQGVAAAIQGWERRILLLERADQDLLQTMEELERRVDAQGGGWRRKREAWVDEESGWENPWAWGAPKNPQKKALETTLVPSSTSPPAQTTRTTSTPPSTAVPTPPMKWPQTPRPRRTSTSTTRLSPPSPERTPPPMPSQPGRLNPPTPWPAPPRSLPPPKIQPAHTSRSTTMTSPTIATTTTKASKIPDGVLPWWSDRDLEYAWGEWEPVEPQGPFGDPAGEAQDRESSPVPLGLTRETHALTSDGYDGPTADLSGLTEPQGQTPATRKWGAAVGAPLTVGMILLLGACWGWKRQRTGTWWFQAAKVEEPARPTVELEPIIRRRKIWPEPGPPDAQPEAAAGEARALVNENYLPMP